MWVQRESTFDNVLRGAMTLFEMSSGDGWVRIMEYTTDNTEVDYGPIMD
jgi:hypothetical protein